MNYRKTFDLVRNATHQELDYIAFRTGVSFSTLRAIKYDKTGRMPQVRTMEKVALGMKRRATPSGAVRLLVPEGISAGPCANATVPASFSSNE
ncbi:MAG: hypothetical protein H0W40_19860 [Methylibium sp.]|uniref:hypothetical protein n=1 Tax=Methylibium sp. TaxID=2067992 RepID=UPI0017D1F817|nr:hypothetical protein [Methylibium sp.]MBA3599597.1 hypothetical protein [Methylibium sp.]